MLGVDHNSSKSIAKRRQRFAKTREAIAVKKADHILDGQKLWGTPFFLEFTNYAPELPKRTAMLGGQFPVSIQQATNLGMERTPRPNAPRLESRNLSRLKHHQSVPSPLRNYSRRFPPYVDQCRLPINKPRHHQARGRPDRPQQRTHKTRMGCFVLSCLLTPWNGPQTADATVRLNSWHPAIKRFLTLRSRILEHPIS